MSFIVLLNADDAYDVEIIQDDEFVNKIFPTSDEADMWIQYNAKVGWCTRIIEIED